MMGRSKLFVCAVAAVSLAGCVPVSYMEQQTLDEIERYGVEQQAKRKKSKPTAALLNLLPGIGCFYLATGTDQKQLVAIGIVDLLLWPSSVLWGIPQAAVDAGNINKKATAKYYMDTAAGKAELQELRARHGVPTKTEVARPTPAPRREPRRERPPDRVAPVKPKRPSPTHGGAPASICNVYVLVIGIGAYKDPNIPALRYTTSDAKAVYEFFKQSPSSPTRPDNVHILGNEPNEDRLVADKRGILLAMDRYLVKKAVRENDMVILYFAGHGELGAHPTKGTEYYLLPQDAVLDSLYITALELSEFQRLWSAVRAKTKILIADACNSGGFSGVRGMGGVTGVEAVTGEAKAVFSACKSDQKSLESTKLGHGLFTHVLLQGLKGKADMVCGNDDQRVTLAELKRWLDQQVPLEARKAGANQTPITSVVDAWGDVYLTR